jgi:hypothetical protein
MNEQVCKKCSSPNSTRGLICEYCGYQLTTFAGEADELKALRELNLHFARRPDRGPRRPIRKESSRHGISEGAFASYTA